MHRTKRFNGSRLWSRRCMYKISPCKASIHCSTQSSGWWAPRRMWPVSLCTKPTLLHKTSIIAKILQCSRRERSQKDSTAPNRLESLNLFIMKSRLGSVLTKVGPVWWTNKVSVSLCHFPLSLFDLAHALPISLFSFLVLTLPPSQMCLKDLSLSPTVRKR